MTTFSHTGEVITFHLGLGSVVLGLAEGWLIATWLRTGKVAAEGLMIVANLLAAWVGYDLLTRIREGGMLSHIPLHDLPALIPWMVVAGYLLTTLLKWPFVAAIVWDKRKREGRGWRREAIGVGAGANVVIYSLLALFYRQGSDLSLIRRTMPVTASAPWIPANAWFYYVREGTGDVYRCRLNGSEQELQVPRAGSVALIPVDDAHWQLIGSDEMIERMNRTAYDRKTNEDNPERWRAAKFDIENRPLFGSVRFTRKATGERVLLKMDSLFPASAFIHTIRLPGDLLLLHFWDRALLVNLDSMEAFELPLIKWEPVVVWEE